LFGEIQRMGAVEMAEIVDVVLMDAGANATNVILALRAVTAKESVLEMVDLQMARRFVDNPPCVVGPNVPLDVGERVKASLEQAGASVELKPA
jgi:ribosomal protein L7/L12